eukprot:656489_1
MECTLVSVCFKLFGHGGQWLEYEYVRMQQQIGTKICGLFAIAAALDHLQGKDVSEISYDQSKMTKHFMQCLLKQRLSTFPRTEANDIVRMAAIKGRMELICECGLPKCFDRTVKCRTSSYAIKVYHRGCVLWQNVKNKSYCIGSVIDVNETKRK